MKKIRTMILPIAAVAMVFAACTKNDADNNSVADNGIIRFVTSEDITKTVFGEPSETAYPTYWTGNEEVAVILNYSVSTAADVTASPDGKSATFAASVADIENESYTFCAVSPVETYKDVNTDGKRLLINIAGEQTPLQGSPDEKVQVIAALSATSDSRPTEVSLSFRHVTAYGLLNIRNLEEGASVQSVSLTSSALISERFYYFPESHSVSEHSTKGSNKIVLNTSDVENVWFAIAPVDLSGTSLTVDVSTDKGIYSKTVSLGADRNLTSGVIAEMSFDFEGIKAVAEKEPITVGEVWKENETAVGVVFWVSEDGSSAKIVSLGRTSSTVAWSTVGEVYLGAGSKTDGEANTETLKSSAQADDMPILSFCAGLGENWYWPACNELKAVYDVKSDVDAALAANAGTAFNEDQYWSSTEFESAPKYASHVNFAKGTVGVAADNINKTGAAKRYGRCVKVVAR